MMREDLLALADELDGVSIKEDCESCLASGTSLCRGDLECAESAHKACAKRLREIVEHDAGEVTTVSAYDLLPEDEREAIAWVREHGGLEAVKASAHQGAMEHGSLLKVAEMLGTSIYDGSDNADALLEKLSERLMPEGMEWLIESWPRFDDDEPARWEDEYENGNGGVSPLRHVSLYADGRAMLGKGKTKVVLAPGERVKRPAPKVLDAEGNRIEPAMDVWWICEGDELGIHSEKLHVESIGDDGFVTCYPYNGGTWVELDSSELHVKKPVLDADGEPTVPCMEDGILGEHGVMVTDHPLVLWDGWCGEWKERE